MCLCMSASAQSAHLALASPVELSNLNPFMFSLFRNGEGFREPSYGRAHAVNERVKSVRVDWLIVN